MNICSKFLARRSAGLAILFISAALALALTPQVSFAGTATVTGETTTSNTETPTIPSAGSQQTSSFAYVSGPFAFVSYPFTVSATGIYSATVYTTTVQNTTWFLNGLFTPGSPPSTPIGNFFAAFYSGPATAGQYLDNFSNLSLIAGQQYTVLVAYNEEGTAGEPSTVTITGPGCIAIGSNTCAAAPAPVPALSEWGWVALAAMVVAIGMVYSRRRQKTA